MEPKNTLNYNENCEMTLLENMMFTLYWCGNTKENSLYDIINTSFYTLSKKYPNVMLKIYVSTSEMLSLKGYNNIPEIIQIGIFPQDFDNYMITDITVQNIIWKIILSRVVSFLMSSSKSIK